jgi:hypothetical protein
MSTEYMNIYSLLEQQREKESYLPPIGGKGGEEGSGERGYVWI